MVSLVSAGEQLAWRTRVLDIALIVVAVSNLPALFAVLFGDLIAPSLWVKVAYVGMELALIAATVFRRWPLRVRGLIWVACTLVTAAIGLSRVGLPGTGRVMLLAISMVSLLLIGRKTGLVVSLAALGILLVLTALADGGFIAEQLVLRENPSDAGFWLFQTSCWLLTAAPTVVICERVLARQEQLLATEQETVRRLAQEVAERVAAHEELQAEVAERQRLEREVLEVGERERREVGHELHDGICQQLTGARLRCQALERRLQQGDLPDPDQLLAIRELLDDSLSQAYALSSGLEPSPEDPATLASSLRDLARRVGETHEIECVASVVERHGIASSAAATQLLRIAQEAVNNAVKHSGCARIDITLVGADGAVELVIADDGQGLRAPRPGERQGMGLRILHFRTDSIGGRLEVASEPGAGTRVRCSLPRPPAAPAQGAAA